MENENNAVYSDVPMIEIEHSQQDHHISPTTLLNNLKTQLDLVFRARYGRAINDHQYTISPLLAANILSDLQVLSNLDSQNPGTTDLLTKYNRLFTQLRKAHLKTREILDRVSISDNHSFCYDVNRVWFILKTVYRLIIILFILVILTIVCVIYSRLKSWF